ncbi:MAG: 4-(cytidine 5'-diphospho)-2-C-methyl-D-erythritol kinase [Candidatus Eisenbacteria bacterium]|uniref:4-diphosphocytidyl-2-C-methyl-D-erythritol kinase n=1 Tax=Eiseniibacteriota bacterium TaxID=2212470 RepID=A0A933SET5_UNCEI|nr:4-(cytidine 5'-diphospho)-2-C-methyl-D-erythritol kinase [Candidatus Eisenbacteria bacterium]
MSPATRPRRVEVTAHAKLNLGLAVGPARDDGFHELLTVFQSVSLADTLVAERTPRGFALRVTHEEAAVRGSQGAAARRAIGPAADNLVVRAARRVHEAFALKGGARFALTKRIPAQAGMGGGSADAAAAIAAVLALHGVRLSLADRLAIGAELGSDVPFALLGGTAIGRGRGDVLTPARLAGGLRAVVAVPAWRVSTAEAFRSIDSQKYGLTRWKRHLRFATSLGRAEVTAFHAARLGNTFEEVLGHQRQEFESLCARLRAAGLVQPRLTGSGSGVFGLVPAGVPPREITGRFIGSEPLYVVRGTVKGLRLRKQS